jgi:hypothetical protein
MTMQCEKQKSMLKPAKTVKTIVMNKTSTVPPAASGEAAPKKTSDTFPHSEE